MLRNEEDEALSVVSFTSNSLAYIYGIQLAKCGLLIDTIINIHESEIKGVNKRLYKLCHITSIQAIKQIIRTNSNNTNMLIEKKIVYLISL